MNNNLDFLPYAETLAQMDPALNYSLASLAVLDRLLACLRQGIIEEQVSPDQMHRMVVGAGAYFAETLRRNFGAEWRCLDGQEPWLHTLVGPKFPFQLARQAISGGDPDTFATAALTYGNAQPSRKEFPP